MAEFKNTMGIGKIAFSVNIQAYCPLGKDWYTNKVLVEFYPNEVIPDYCEVEKELRAMAGQELTVEGCVAQVFDHLAETYKPNRLLVKSYADDAVHFPVEVMKERILAEAFDEDTN